MFKYFQKLTINSKLMILTLFITFLVVIITGGISFFLQTKAMKENLTSHVAEISSLFSSTISSQDLAEIIELKDKTSPTYQKLASHLNLINESDTKYLHACIVAPKLIDNEVFFLVPSSKMTEEPFSTIDTKDEFKEALLKSAYYKKVTHSKVYREHGSYWIAAFAPIVDRNNQILGAVAISGDVSVIGSFFEEMLYYFSVIFIIITCLVFYLFKWGLRKVLAPMNEIMNGINEVSKGNFQVKLPARDQSDLGKLTERFNHMTEQLSLLFERLTLTSKQLGKEGYSFRQASAFEEAIGEMEHIIQRTKILKELQRAEKMNAIGQLAASVAHEIRNPMTVVKGFLQIFKSKKELSSEEQMFIKLMIDEMNRAETIINDYLSLAKPDMESTEKVDAVDLAHKVMELMNSYALMSKNINLDIFTEEEVFVNGNRSELKQVLINILKNGIEALKDGGTLSLRVYRNESFGIFEVKDNGIGMTSEELDRLGTAFYSLKEKGTGMGLMVCYQIIERMKGRIDVVSEKNVGTTFTISVPLDEEMRES
ncbi:ATP-binding protein [Robertmurraya andreesenii]|uniref:histidine kinase n=1 Tax=Anoxybacillus andreesenii TaxID=1325932 RepID=A0ABT9V2D5_9BACL|nr:ATP-binding protein [Robertmurraya andreesenii]MDQ0155106.1 signal transduction histidine kinase [Robertmurraya andreesenii]